MVDPLPRFHLPLNPDQQPEIHVTLIEEQSHRELTRVGDGGTELVVGVLGLVQVRVVSLTRIRVFVAHNNPELLFLRHSGHGSSSLSQDFSIWGWGWQGNSAGSAFRFAGDNCESTI